MGHLLVLDPDALAQQIQGEFYDPVSQFLNGFTTQENSELMNKALYAYVRNEAAVLSNSPPPGDINAPLIILTRRMQDGHASERMIEEPDAPANEQNAEQMI